MMKYFAGGLGRIVNNDGSVCDGDLLLEEIRQRIRSLKRLGARPDDRIIIAHGGSHEFFADLYAVWEVGACAVCINPASTAPELNNIASFTRARLILVSEDFRAEKFSGTARVECLSLNSRGLNYSSLRSEDHFDLDRPALILFTSGTTADPKGVMHSLRSVLARLTTNVNFIGSGVLRNSLCILPTHFGHGLLGNCLTPLFSGGNLYLRALDNVTAAKDVGSIIDEEVITFFSSVPSMWNMLLRVSRRPLRDSLEQVNVGSGPLSSELWNSIIQWTGIQNVVNVYGITETANWISGISSVNHRPEDGLVGRVWSGEALVRLPSGEIAKCGEGEILVKTPSMMIGYLDRPEETAKSFVDSFYATGDIGYLTDDGMIKLLGRAKLEINRGGIKISPEEVELLLEKHPEISEACVFGISDPIVGELMGVAVVPCESLSDRLAIESRWLSEIKQWLDARIVGEKTPDKWYIRGHIPKTDRGKINRRQVIADCLGLDNSA